MGPTTLVLQLLQFSSLFLFLSQSYPLYNFQPALSCLAGNNSGRGALAASWFSRLMRSEVYISLLKCYNNLINASRVSGQGKQLGTMTWKERGERFANESHTKGRRHDAWST